MHSFCFDCTGTVNVKKLPHRCVKLTCSSEQRKPSLTVCSHVVFLSAGESLTGATQGGCRASYCTEGKGGAAGGGR